LQASNEAESGIPSQLPDRRSRNERSVWFPASRLYSRRCCFDLSGRTVRADDMLFDSFCSPSIQTLRMAFGEGGKVTAMEHQAAAGWPTQVVMPSFMPKGVNNIPFDPFSISGADQITGTMWERKGFVLSQTISPTAPSALAGCARSAQAGPIGWSKASWTKRLTRRASILSNSASACLTAPAGMRVWR
jgi:hypothetical protein